MYHKLDYRAYPPLVYIGMLAECIGEVVMDTVLPWNTFFVSPLPGRDNQASQTTRQPRLVYIQRKIVIGLIHTSKKKCRFNGIGVCLVAPTP